MATISKFYLHDVATANTGTMPSGAYIAIPGQVASSGNATGALTARAATDTIGVLETNSVITSTASTSGQNWGHRRFVSAPLAAQTFATADGTWTFSYAAAESNTNHNGDILGMVYAWRPSTGLRVGTGSVELNGPAFSATAKTVYSNHSGSWSSTSTTILDGDILVFEISDAFLQGMATAYTSTFYYDGTTEASTTSSASFVTPPAALTLFTAGSGITYLKAGHAVESA